MGMKNCSSLTNIDLTPLSHVQSIGNVFLYSCSGLITIKCNKTQKELFESKLSIKHKQILKLVE